MENNNYDEYIRNILGYQPVNQPNYYENDIYRDNFVRNNYSNYYEDAMYNNMNRPYYDNNFQNNNMNIPNSHEQSFMYNVNQANKLKRDIEVQIEQYYPDTYRDINTIIKKKCDETREIITEESIENMVDDIYNEYVSINERNTRKDNQVMMKREEISNVKDMRIDKKNNNQKEDQGIRETRQSNRWLRDLIKILLLKELINRPGLFPPHPPRPGVGIRG